MFSNQANAKSPNQELLKSKNQKAHQGRAIQQRDKIRKTIRFENRIEQILSLNANSNQYKRILEIQPSQVSAQLRNMMNTQELQSLACSVINLLKSDEFTFTVNSLFIKDFIQFSENLMHKPEIICVFRILSEYHPDFHENVFEKMEIVERIVKQISGLRQSNCQFIYMQTLKHLMQKGSKRWQSQICGYFDQISRMIEQTVIPFEGGLAILKAISPLISKSRKFQISTIQILLDCYERQMNQNNQYTDLMVDCFLVLTKVIFNQSNTSIVCTMRLLRMLLNAKQVFPAKIVDQYYNIYSLLSNLLISAQQHEIKEVSYAEYQKCRSLLIQKFQCVDDQEAGKQCVLLNMILDKVLQENKFIFNEKHYSISYLNFLSTLAQIWSSNTSVDLYIKTDFFEFIIQCIDHTCLEIILMALQIILKVIALELHGNTLLQTLKYYYNLEVLLESKFNSHFNQKVVKLSELILEKLKQFKYQ